MGNPRAKVESIVCVEAVNSLPQGRSTILGRSDAKFRDRFQSVDGLPLVCWKVLYMVSGFLTSELCIVAKGHVFLVRNCFRSISSMRYHRSRIGELKFEKIPYSVFPITTKTGLWYSANASQELNTASLPQTNLSTALSPY